MQDFDNMPMRESMRDTHKGIPWYVEDVNKIDEIEEKLKKDYRVIDRKLKRSINQNYDNVYSWLCNKYKAHSHFGYLKSYFLDKFVETASTFNKEEKAPYKLDKDKKIIKAE